MFSEENFCYATVSENNIKNGKKYWSWMCSLNIMLSDHKAESSVKSKKIVPFWRRY